MKEFTVEQIQERFDQLPPEVKVVISSPEVRDKITTLAKGHGLMIDQQGELVDHIGLVMLGLARSSDFVRDISSRLGIDNDTAKEIAGDVNREVFDSIRDHMREADEPKPVTPIASVDNSSLEAAGGFTIEHELPGNGEAAAERESLAAQAMTSQDRSDLLQGIENPPPIVERPALRPMPQPEPVRSEPLVDQLLKGSASIPEEKLVRKIAEPTKIPASGPSAQPPKNLPTNDPYREPIK